LREFESAAKPGPPVFAGSVSKPANAHGTIIEIIFKIIM
jgi:hypothetical protein